MGASPLMSLGMRAMAANYAALQVTGHNIANANVPGYSRQRVELATALGQFTGAGYFGKGSDVQTVTRAHNAFLTREVMTTQGLASKDQARLDNLQRLESLLPLGEDGVGYATQEFLSAFSDLASLPGDSSARQVVLARAEELALRFSEAGAQMVELQTSLRQDLEATVAKVNELTSNIARLNGQIAAARGFGQPPNDLMDARDQLLSDLSKEIGITTVAADDGSIGVFAGGGQRLVLSNSAQQLSVVNDAGDPSRAALAVVNGTQLMRLEADELGGGRIAGLLGFQNKDLVDAQVQLGQLAAAIGGAINEQQKLGLTLRPPVGSVPATDLFALGAPRALPMAGNVTDSLGRPLGSVSLEITDPAQLQASEYELRASTARPGSFELTRLSDGESRLVQDGDEVDGLRITLGSPAPQPGDRFLLQPVTQAAASMRSLLTDARDIAAASPLTATVSAANSGTMAIASLTITDPSVDPQLSANIAFSDADGNYNWELRDRVTNALVSSGIGHWESGEKLPSAPDSPINGFALTLSGRPAAGDVLTVSMTTNAAANNGNALALAALRDQVLVGRILQPDGSLAGGATATDAYAATLADVGVRVQGAESIAEISGALAAGAESARSSEAGVNLDEEAALLIQYQQSYQAAAKVLQIAQSVFDTLLSVAGG